MVVDKGQGVAETVHESRLCLLQLVAVVNFYVYSANFRLAAHTHTHISVYVRHSISSRLLPGQASVSGSDSESGSG